MRRYSQYLVFIGTLVILFISSFLFYFNDSLLADSRGQHHQLELRLAEIQFKLGQKVGPIMQKDWGMLSGNNFTLQRANNGRGRALKHSTSRGRLKGNTNSLKRDRAVLNGTRDTATSTLQLSHRKPLYRDNVSSSRNIGVVGIGVLNRTQVNESQARRLGPVKGTHLNSISLKTGRDRQSNETHLRGKKSFTKYIPSSHYLLPRPCSDPLCTRFLSERDMVNFTACKRRAEAKYSVIANHSAVSAGQLTARMGSDGLLPSGSCHFMNGTGRGPVGLVSFPGSGNTWVRGLLQKATGICTGQFSNSIFVCVVSMCTCKRLLYCTCWVVC